MARFPSRPVTRDEFKNYILRQIGANEVNDIEISDDQLEDVVNDAISDFQEYHKDGWRERLLLLRRTPGQTRYELPDDILAVNNVLQSRYSYFFHGGTSDIHLLFSNYGQHMFLGSPPDGQTLTTYYIMEQHYQQIRQTLVANPSYDFNFLEGVLEFRSATPPTGSVWQEHPQYFILEVVTVVDETVNPKIYSHKWLREYATAKAGLLWGIVLMKFDGTFPDGSKVNASDIRFHWQGEIERLRREAIESDQIAEPFIW